MISDLKVSIYNAVKQWAEQRVLIAQEAMDMAQESANGDSKSSAGDKHETGRAMAQLEQEKSAKQLRDALGSIELLKRIDPNSVTPHVVTGSLVTTDEGIYYISIAAGKIMLAGKEYFAVSPSSPIGKKLLGLSVGSTIELNGRKMKILQIS